MEGTQMLMNMVFASITLVNLFIITPPYLVFKLISFIIRSINPENVAGKVVLITGASSGIGEYLAYEYARRGARLLLAARRHDRLREVADKARHLGSPDVMVIPTDVSDIQHCQRLVDEAINHFGQLDHLVNNAGIADACMFEDSNLPDLTPVMNVNFWGSVYTTRFAVPHLKKSKGKIIVIASVAAWLPAPVTSMYNASKAAMIMFFESLRIEFGSDIGITIVTPGFIESEMNKADYLSKILSYIPIASTEGCAEAIVNSACRGDKYLIQPSWYRLVFWCKVLCPEMLDWFGCWLMMPTPKTLCKGTN